MSASATQGGHN